MERLLDGGGLPARCFFGGFFTPGGFALLDTGVNENSYPCGPAGIVWSHADVATTTEIVECFEALDHHEMTAHNWGTCFGDCRQRWCPTDETYINGVMMTLDFDYMMGYLIQAVDRTSSQCTFIAIVLYHGRRRDGTFEKDWMVWPGTHTFYEAPEHQVEITHWGVSVIHGMVEAHEDALRQR